MEFKGVCANPGRVVGIIVDSLDEEGIYLADTLKPYEIIDPKKTKGMILKRSGLLSHGAIIAREFNVPCVVKANVPDLKGKKVELDAGAGIIRVL